MITDPLPEGQVPIAEQAAKRGEPVPVGLTIKQLREAGYDVIAGKFPDDAVFKAHDLSPTGYAIVFPFAPAIAEWSLAT